MNRVLLADFGSTRIKLLLWDRCTGLVDREERPGAVPIRSDGGRFETSPEFYWRTLESAVGELFRRSAAHASGERAGLPLVLHRNAWLSPGRSTRFPALSIYRLAGSARSTDGMRAESAAPWT